MERFICIHGHFYQPPRENPWLEAIELQDSAYPYHDWNERVTAECYAPNATARLMDVEGRIDQIVNNYSKISFNFGPTVLAWMRDKVPEVHEAIVTADEMSRERFSGHGSALAQAFNHMIMPLANRRDKYTQVAWGIADFEFRFGRKPEGMWLPETAVDSETLDVLADLGIKFTILSPYQASRVRRLGARNWRDVNGGRVDPSMPYEVRLASGRKIVVFFYDGPISQAVAFERLLNDGKRFAHRLTDAFDESRSWEQLVHIATDGESYGHHHRQGEMALAYALDYIEKNKLGRLTNYGEYLEKHPPTHEAQIHEGSAWSCSHGVGRWRSNCGCNSGGRSNWSQEWRGPLREALDWLRDQLAPRFEAKGKEYFKDPWKARDGYIGVILDRSPQTFSRFCQEHGLAQLQEGGNWGEGEGAEKECGVDRVAVLRLMELQRHAMLMYTSCGWFFDELSGIETVQVIQYAGRAIQLAHHLFEEDLEPGFLDILGKARSNIREHRDGRQVYKKFVKPAMITLEKVGAHYAVSSLFETYPEQSRIYSFTFDQEARSEFVAGQTRLAIGRARVTFEITRETAVVTYAVLHFGDHSLNGGVRIFQGTDAYEQLVEEMKGTFDRADFPEIIRLMDRHFGESNYSLKSLFRDEQRKILNLILQSTREDLETHYRQIADRYTPLMRFLASLGAPKPRELELAGDFVLNADLRRQFEADHTDVGRVKMYLEEVEQSSVALDTQALSYALKGKVDRLMQQLSIHPENLDALEQLNAIAEILPSLPFEVNLWKTQNLYYAMLNTVYPEMQERAKETGSENEQWLATFRSLGERLGFRVEGGR